MAARTRRNRGRKGARGARQQPTTSARIADRIRATGDEAPPDRNAARPPGPLAKPFSKPQAKPRAKPHTLPPHQLAKRLPRGQAKVKRSPEMEAGTFLSPEQQRLMRAQRDAARQEARLRRGLVLLVLAAVLALAGLVWLGGRLAGWV
ncbi:hypothetical protein [Azospirillum thermophilum]|uniref:Uncharacterized protein n=1 Tax=Azospirillum thermophilum TaxID=2202148 RepID=A0A2S2CMP4_9PROT|nr:hypothetical protein [Azospirillum thermophilum]AWK85699.1 hypothetical protein DEW08_05555 [Azospirillum thermophilum]